MLRPPNTDGIVNWLRRARTEENPQIASLSKLWSVLGCLLQPGQLRNQLYKSMLVTSFRLINLCTVTNPAVETKSIGLQADAQLAAFLLSVYKIHRDK
jgi:hypothetical protein